MNAATLDGLPSGREPARLRCLCAAASLVALALHGPAARGATLAELFAGGSIDAGAARFQSWQLVSVDATTGSLPNLSQIIVTPLTNPATNPGLQFDGAGQLAASDINALDIIFRYRVSTIGAANSFAGQALGLTGATLTGNSGVAYVSHEVTRADGVDLAAAVVFSDNETNAVQLADESPFAPHTGPWVTVNVFLSGLAIGDSANLTSFTQRFSQTGPTVLAGDFNLDGAVDGSDFLRWQRGNSPNPVSAQDLADWRSNYGIDLNASPTQRSTPEPSTTCHLLLGACGLLAMRPCFRISRPLV
jgi:hypothetical protein